MASPTFTLRLDEDIQQDLKDLAFRSRRTAADIARQFIEEGVARSLDPDEIEIAVNKERLRMLERAEVHRKAREAREAGRES